MRFAVVVLACVLAVAHAQLIPNTGRYNPDSGRYQANRYNTNQYNRYNNNNQYNRYNKNQYNPFNNQYNRNQNNQYTPFKAFVTSTPFPRPSVTVTPAPAVVPKLNPVSVVTPVVTPAPFVPVAPVAPVRPVVPAVTAAARVAVDARSAETVKYGNEISPDGAYNYFFETNNGIAAQAEGVPRNFGGNPPVAPAVAQGSFSWYAPEGQLVALQWVADENGYRAIGDAIPQSPPVPDQIARALAYVARNAPVPAVVNANYNN